MKDCWQDGDLRAYVDGELPAESLQQIADHLEICHACGQRYHELSDRATHVSALLATLSEVPPAAPAPRLRPRRRWHLAALPLAAALAIAFLALPKHRAVRYPVSVAVAPAPVTVAKVEAPIVRPRPFVRHTKPRTSQPEEFVRLDDEPLETGMIVRVTADNGSVQAEMIIGPDGRAHAIRVVANQ
jgi:anti-sigma factor RsiW